MKIRNVHGINSIPRVIKLFSGKQLFTAHIKVTGRSSSADSSFLIAPPVYTDLDLNSIPTTRDSSEIFRAKKRKYFKNFENPAVACNNSSRPCAYNKELTVSSADYTVSQFMSTDMNGSRSPVPLLVCVLCATPIETRHIIPLINHD